MALWLARSRQHERKSAPISVKSLLLRKITQISPNYVVYLTSTLLLEPQSRLKIGDC
jgi:hypothetical protein